MNFPLWKASLVAVLIAVQALSTVQSQSTMGHRQRPIINGGEQAVSQPSTNGLEGPSSSSTAAVINEPSAPTAPPRVPEPSAGQAQSPDGHAESLVIAGNGLEVKQAASNEPKISPSAAIPMAPPRIQEASEGRAQSPEGNFGTPVMAGSVQGLAQASTIEPKSSPSVGNNEPATPIAPPRVPEASAGQAQGHTIAGGSEQDPPPSSPSTGINEPVTPPAPSSLQEPSAGLGQGFPERPFIPRSSQVPPTSPPTMRNEEPATPPVPFRLPEPSSIPAQGYPERPIIIGDGQEPPQSSPSTGINEPVTLPASSSLQEPSAGQAQGSPEGPFIPRSSQETQPSSPPTVIKEQVTPPIPSGLPEPSAGQAQGYHQRPTMIGDGQEPSQSSPSMRNEEPTTPPIPSGLPERSAGQAQGSPERAFIPRSSQEPLPSPPPTVINEAMAPPLGSIIGGDRLEPPPSPMAVPQVPFRLPEYSGAHPQGYSAQPISVREGRHELPQAPATKPMHPSPPASNPINEPGSPLTPLRVPPPRPLPVVNESFQPPAPPHHAMAVAHHDPIRRGTASRGYRPPPGALRREAKSSGQCAYDGRKWKMEPKAAIAAAIMFHRETGVDCEGCLAKCEQYQKVTTSQQWICRSVTYDNEWKICDMFSVNGTESPYFLIEHHERDYFEYSPLTDQLEFMPTTKEESSDKTTGNTSRGKTQLISKSIRDELDALEAKARAKVEKELERFASRSKLELKKRDSKESDRDCQDAEPKKSARKRDSKRCDSGEKPQITNSDEDSLPTTPRSPRRGARIGRDSREDEGERRPTGSKPASNAAYSARTSVKQGELGPDEAPREVKARPGPLRAVMTIRKVGRTEESNAKNEATKAKNEESKAKIDESKPKNEESKVQKAQFEEREGQTKASKGQSRAHKLEKQTSEEVDEVNKPSGTPMRPSARAKSSTTSIIKAGNGSVEASKAENDAGHGEITSGKAEIEAASAEKTHAEAENGAGQAEKASVEAKTEASKAEEASSKAARAETASENAEQKSPKAKKPPTRAKNFSPRAKMAPLDGKKAEKKANAGSEEAKTPRREEAIAEMMTELERRHGHFHHALHKSSSSRAKGHGNLAIQPIGDIHDTVSDHENSMGGEASGEEEGKRRLLKEFHEELGAMEKAQEGSQPRMKVTVKRIKTKVVKKIIEESASSSSNQTEEATSSSSSFNSTSSFVPIGHASLKQIHIPMSINNHSESHQSSSAFSASSHSAKNKPSGSNKVEERPIVEVEGEFSSSATGGEKPTNVRAASIEVENTQMGPDSDLEKAIVEVEGEFSPSGKGNGAPTRAKIPPAMAEMASMKAKLASTEGEKPSTTTEPPQVQAVGEPFEAATTPNKAEIEMEHPESAPAGAEPGSTEAPTSEDGSVAALESDFSTPSPSAHGCPEGHSAHYLHFPQQPSASANAAAQKWDVVAPGVTTLDACLNMCDGEKEFECQSVRFNRQSGHCELSSSTAKRTDPKSSSTSDQVNPSKSSSDHENDSGVSYLEKVCLPTDMKEARSRMYSAVDSHILVGHVQEVATAVNASHCLKSCLSAKQELGFVCKSAMWYPEDDVLNCLLNSESRHSKPDVFAQEDQGAVVIYIDTEADHEAKKRTQGKKTRIDELRYKDSPMTDSERDSVGKWTRWSKCMKLKDPAISEKRWIRYRYQNCAYEHDVRKCRVEAMRCRMA